VKYFFFCKVLNKIYAENGKGIYYTLFLYAVSQYFDHFIFILTQDEVGEWFGHAETYLNVNVAGNASWLILDL
jgi:hypothetical protein